MKYKNMKAKISIFVALALLLSLQSINGQDAQSKPAKPVKNTFEDGGLINNKSVEVLRKHALEMVIHHRMGKIDQMFEDDMNFDFFGVFGPANIQIGMNYGITNKLTVGIGGVKNSNGYYLQAKYRVLQQTKSGSIPVSVTGYANVENNITKDSKYSKFAYRLSYFSQLMVARKLSKRFSLQLAGSYTHFNFVDDDVTELANGIQIRDTHDNFSLTTDLRISFSPQGSILLEYTHPFMESSMYDRKPDLGLGLEFATGAHAFQVLIGTARGLINQQVTNYNTNDFTKGEFLLGFNITRRWNF